MSMPVTFSPVQLVQRSSQCIIDVNMYIVWRADSRGRTVSAGLEDNINTPARCHLTVHRLLAIQRVTVYVLYIYLDIIYMLLFIIQYTLRQSITFLRYLITKQFETRTNKCRNGEQILCRRTTATEGQSLNKS